MKLNYKVLGPKFGKYVKDIEKHFNDNKLEIENLLKMYNRYSFMIDEEKIVIEKSDIIFG